MKFNILDLERVVQECILTNRQMLEVIGDNTYCLPSSKGSYCPYQEDSERELKYCRKKQMIKNYGELENGKKES